MLAILFGFLALWVILWYLDRDEAMDSTKVFLVTVGITLANVGVILGMGAVTLSLGEALGYLTLPAIVLVDAFLLCWWNRMPLTRALLASSLLLGAIALFGVVYDYMTAR